MDRIPKEIQFANIELGEPCGRRCARGPGHVKVESGAGVGAGEDRAYEAAGAQSWRQPTRLGTPGSDQVKEPRGRVASHAGGSAPVHLPSPRSGCAADAGDEESVVAYETVELADRSLPLLRPMSKWRGG